MKLSCPSCSAKYSIADEKVQDRLAKIRCRKCSATIIIDGKVDPPNVYTSDGQAADPGGSGAAPGEVGPGEYSVDFGDSDQRTMNIAQIVDAYNAGEITAETYVWTEGMGDWSPLGDVPEINDALHAAHAAASQPAGAVAAPLGAAPAEEPNRAAARTGAGRGSATDLFGSVASAGSEEDVMTSAPAADPAPPAPAAMATGARNESSVLFSLSALTAAAGSDAPAGPAAPSGPSKSSEEGDDSGLIDLKALTSATSNEEPASPLHIGAAPLGMAAPLGGMAAPAATADIDIPAQQKSGSKTGIMIMGGMLGMGAIIAAAIIATSGGSGQDSAAAAAASAAAAAEQARVASPEPEPEKADEDKKEEVTAKPPATGTAEPEEEAPKEEEKAAPAPAPKPAVRRTYKRTAPKAAPSPSPSPAPVAAPAPAPEPAPKKKKKKSKSCNCAPSDLLCAMKCASG